MTVAAEGVSRPQTGVGAGVVPLLVLAIFINYVDRGNLATAAPAIKGTLNLNAAQLGLLLSSFYWTYTPGQIVAGWLGERINAYRTLALGLAIWSIATAATGLATGFASLIALRLLLGIGESAAFPCSSKLLAQMLPPHRLGKANGAIATGLALGPAFGTFVGGLLIAQWGWRYLFVAFGVVSLAWLAPWLWTTRNLAITAASAHDARAPSYLAILRRQEAWGASLGHFAGNFGFYFVISWLPTYLVNDRGFTMAQMGAIGGLIYLVYAASSMATGILADHFMQRGWTPNRVRKIAMAVSYIGVALCLIICPFLDRRMAVACLMLAGIFFGPATASIYAIGQTLAGPRAAGKWIGVQNCVGNIAGMIGPWITGELINRTGQYFWAFALACAITLVGVFAWTVMIPRIAPLDWSTAE